MLDKCLLNLREAAGDRHQVDRYPCLPHESSQEGTPGRATASLRSIFQGGCPDWVGNCPWMTRPRGSAISWELTMGAATAHPKALNAPSCARGQGTWPGQAQHLAKVNGKGLFHGNFVGMLGAASPPSPPPGCLGAEPGKNPTTPNVSRFPAHLLNKY